jgi:hypothetical protein
MTKCGLCGHKNDHDFPDGCTGRVWPKTGGAVRCGCKTFTKMPLRKVLGIVGVPIEDRPGAAVIPKELYECGHVFTQKEDIYGPTNAFRRRCGACAKGMPPDPKFLERAKNWPKN